jgi:hypothetical protein
MFERFTLKGQLKNALERIEELEEGLRTLRGKVGGLELEWANTLDKLNHIAGRMAKRAALAQEKEDALMGELPSAGEPAAGLSTLSPRARLIQQQVLARRRAQNGGGE